MSGGAGAGLAPGRMAALQSWLAGQAGARSVAVIDEGRLGGGAISLNLAVTLEIGGGLSVLPAAMRVSAGSRCRMHSA